MPRRSGFPWSINEILKLQREYELLCLSVDEIADLHERSEAAIIYKLEAEGFKPYISNKNVATRSVTKEFNRSHSS